MSDLQSLLIVAYHFPPIQGSSGVHRTLSFARYLPDSGWRPTVLTVRPTAYANVEVENESLLGDKIRVVRCFALDAQRHLAVFGKYPQILAVPDRWQSWIASGVIAGLRLIKAEKPKVIFSTYPIASAHVIARTLHRRTGLPWIADMRDPMLFETYPPPGTIRNSYKDIEESVFREASCVTVTTPGAARLYRKRYGDVAAGKLRVIENGYDDELFDRIGPAPKHSSKERKLSLLHSGVIYRDARNPRPLFEVLSRLKSEGAVDADSIEVVFRASGQEGYLRQLAQEHRIEEIVKLKPSVSYERAAREMLESDGLLLIQANNCNDQIPAKAYEYLRCRKPILALCDPVGDTGQLLSRYNVKSLCALEDSQSMEDTVRAYLRVWRARSSSQVPSEKISCLTRKNRTGELATILDEMQRG